MTIHNTAQIHPSVEIGEGTIIGAFVEIREGVKIGKGCKIDSYVCITGDAVIGDNTIIRNRVTIARGSRIGNNVFIAPHCMFNNLDLSDSDRRTIGGAKIGDNVHIGTNTILHHGITIESNSIIGACSFVRHDVGEYQVWYGNPAECKKRLYKSQL